MNWVQRFDTFCFLDNHQYQIEPHTQECLIGAGIRRAFTGRPGQGLDGLQLFIKETKDGWLFGHLNYDLQISPDQTASSHPDGIRFPDLFFFEPLILLRLSPGSLVIEADEPGEIFDAINEASPSTSTPGKRPVTVNSRLSREEYLTTVRRLRQHILRGDCYEINFCQEFFAEDAQIDPVKTYRQLSLLSPNPFSALYRLQDKWLICASPERFLKKQGSRILSQPIKGTLKRRAENGDMDAQEKKELFQSAKDRSENVMVVDLVRNDLAKICQEGTVKVDELYGIYSFPQVHQMISTISGELRPDADFSMIMRACFPMGSMTGAPKKRVMELIEQYEVTKRGVFSGAVGYISPTGNFDLNVVIRSILYNASTAYLSFQTGSGITFYSDPEMEWEECLLKASAIKKILSEP